MQDTMRTIGIMGGMGPEATAALYMEIVHIFQQRFGARLDADFPPMHIASLPVPDVVARVENEAELIRRLQEGARSLERAGADFLLIACNTVQVYLPKIHEVTHLPVIDLIEEVADLLVRGNHRTAGLLATQASCDGGIFHRVLERRGVTVITPPPPLQARVTRAILEILGGEPAQPSRDALIPALDWLSQQGARAAILGCTELPLVLRSEDTDLELIDTIRVLAEAAVREARATRSAHGRPTDHDSNTT